MATTIRFTPSEWEIIEHRLSEPDAIAEALTDHCDGEDPVVQESPQEVRDAACKMAIEGPTVMLTTTLQRAILADACDGSTFFASMEDEEDAATTGKWLRHAKAIERKLAKFGISVSVATL